MKKFANGKLGSGGDCISRVYLLEESDGTITFDVGTDRPTGFRATGYVEIEHSGMYPGTAGEYNNALKDAAEDALVGAGIARRSTNEWGIKRTELVGQ